MVQESSLNNGIVRGSLYYAAPSERQLFHYAYAPHGTRETNIEFVEHVVDIKALARDGRAQAVPRGAIPAREDQIAVGQAEFRQELGAALNCHVSSCGQESTGSFRPLYAGFTRIRYGPSFSTFPLMNAIAFGSDAMYDVSWYITWEVVDVARIVAAASDQWEVSSPGLSR